MFKVISIEAHVGIYKNFTHNFDTEYEYKIKLTIILEFLDPTLYLY
jgi:hypothetical protein